jgi:GlpG protein
MYLACQCDPAVPIQPMLDQLEKQNIVFQLVHENSLAELWVLDASLVEPVSQFYSDYRVQVIEQQKNSLTIDNLKNTPITSILLMITLVVALITQLGSQFTDWFFIAQIQYYPRSWFLYEGIQNIWRVVSPIFLHFGIEHIIFNALSFWYLGSVLERKLGMIVFILLVIALAVVSNVSQLIVSGPLFGGLSGVVYGFIGFAFLYQQFIADLNVPKGLLYVAIGWMLLGMTNVLAVIGFGNMANTAHLSGLMTGFIAFLVYKITMNLFFNNKGVL